MVATEERMAILQDLRDHIGHVVEVSMSMKGSNPRLNFSAPNGSFGDIRVRHGMLTIRFYDMINVDIDLGNPEYIDAVRERLSDERYRVPWWSNNA